MPVCFSHQFAFEADVTHDHIWRTGLGSYQIPSVLPSYLGYQGVPITHYKIYMNEIWYNKWHPSFTHSGYVINYAQLQTLMQFKRAISI